MLQSATPLLNVDDVVQALSDRGRGRSVRSSWDHVSLRLNEGEIVGLLGRSGCGKSSLLRIVAGLTFPAEGKVTYAGAAVTGPVEGVAMVFQSFALFSVAEPCWPTSNSGCAPRA